MTNYFELIQNVRRQTEAGEHYEHAKSWCYCGHKGDGHTSDNRKETSVHGGINGHGPCQVEGCDCQQFTWKAWTRKFLKFQKGRD